MGGEIREIGYPLYQESFCPPLWDGKTASRAVAALKSRLEEAQVVRLVDHLEALGLLANVED